MITKSTELMTRLSRLLADGCRIGFILFLAILVSGLVPLLIQSYGWYDMAQKAGGMDKIIQVMTETPPCEFCRAAQEMQRESDTNKNSSPSQPSKDKIEVAKVYAVMLKNDLFNAQWFSLPDSRIRRAIGNDLLPESLAQAPITPPPEFFV